MEKQTPTSAPDGHGVYDLHAHLVFVTTYRRRTFRYERHGHLFAGFLTLAAL